MPGIDFAPRALLRRPLVTVELTPSELSLLIDALEAKARRAAEDFDQVDFADFLFVRIANLREAFR